MISISDRSGLSKAAKLFTFLCTGLIFILPFVGILFFGHTGLLGGLVISMCLWAGLIIWDRSIPPPPHCNCADKMDLAQGKHPCICEDS